MLFGTEQKVKHHVRVVGTWNGMVIFVQASIWQSTRTYHTRSLRIGTQVIKFMHFCLSFQYNSSHTYRHDVLASTLFKVWHITLKVIQFMLTLFGFLRKLPFYWQYWQYPISPYSSAWLFSILTYKLKWYSCLITRQLRGFGDCHICNLSQTQLSSIPKKRIAIEPYSDEPSAINCQMYLSINCRIFIQMPHLYSFTQWN